MSFTIGKKYLSYQPLAALCLGIGFGGVLMPGTERVQMREALISSIEVFSS